MQKLSFFICFVLSLAASVAVAVDYIVVDDFDSYADDNALRVVWKDSISGGVGGNAEVRVNKNANFAVDGNSMQFEYMNDLNPWYSETKRSYSPGQDWSYATAGVTALEIKFFGDADNIKDPPIYVKLSDDTNTAQVNHTDNNDVLEEWQHTWVIPLSDFTDVNLSNITGITIGIGDKVAESGPPHEFGTIYFDDFRLYPPRCFPEYGPAADFTDDCNVDVNDLFFVAQDWCMTGYWEADPYTYIPLNSFADLCVGIKDPNDPNAPIDDQIDFCDWSKFADEWLETKLWPQP